VVCCSWDTTRSPVVCYRSEKRRSKSMVACCRTETRRSGRWPAAGAVGLRGGGGLLQGSWAWACGETTLDGRRSCSMAGALVQELGTVGLPWTGGHRGGAGYLHAPDAET
jgi:hypothetical protein